MWNLPTFNLFTGMEPDIVLHATVLAIGCATFFGVILCSRCPDCGWHEWVGELFDRDRDTAD
jgi:hypothetical protein